MGNLDRCKDSKNEDHQFIITRPDVDDFFEVYFLDLNKLKMEKFVRFKLLKGNTKMRD